MKDKLPNVFKLVKTNSALHFSKTNTALHFLKNNNSLASASDGIIFDKIQGRVCFNYYI